ncbi:hypothetical protein I4U23_031457 [Adineta vaga]|nr:hypothetical protein I4U23_031457 [Adineta vaga]
MNTCVSDWSIAQSTNLNKRDSTEQKSISVWKFCRYCSLNSSFFKGLILGILTFGLVLAVVITLWLTSDRKTTIANVPSTNTILTTSTTMAISTATTTTMATSTTMTTTTTTATISNTCTGGSTYTTQLLYLSMTSTLSWTKYTFNYTAPNILSAKLTFALRNDPDFWYLDDVSVTNSSGNQLLSNGNFEQGILGNWIYCNPNSANYSGAITSNYPRTGSYSYEDGSVGSSDYLSQTFAVTPNSKYSIKFWLSSGSNSSSFAFVTISS